MSRDDLTRIYRRVLRPLLLAAKTTAVGAERLFVDVNPPPHNDRDTADHILNFLDTVGLYAEKCLDDDESYQLGDDVVAYLGPSARSVPGAPVI